MDDHEEFPFKKSGGLSFLHKPSFGSKIKLLVSNREQKLPVCKSSKELIKDYLDKRKSKVTYRYGHPLLKMNNKSR